MYILLSSWINRLSYERWICFTFDGDPVWVSPATWMGTVTTSLTYTHSYLLREREKKYCCRILSDTDCLRGNMLANDFSHVNYYPKPSQVYCWQSISSHCRDRNVNNVWRLLMNCRSKTLQVGGWGCENALPRKATPRLYLARQFHFCRLTAHHTNAYPIIWYFHFFCKCQLSWTLFHCCRCPRRRRAKIAPTFPDRHTAWATMEGCLLTFKRRGLSTACAGISVSRRWYLSRVLRICPQVLWLSRVWWRPARGLLIPSDRDGTWFSSQGDDASKSKAWHPWTASWWCCSTCCYDFALLLILLCENMIGASFSVCAPSIEWSWLFSTKQWSSLVFSGVRKCDSQYGTVCCLKWCRCLQWDSFVIRCRCTNLSVY